MAMISQGEVLMSGEPRAAIATLRERIWSKRVSAAALAEYQQRFSVLSSRMIDGQPLIHIYSETSPGEGFTAVDPALEDVYFQRLHAHRSTTAAAA
jgi:ABC-2 type transport system ATP-binding protein